MVGALYFENTKVSSEMTFITQLLSICCHQKNT